LDRHVARRAAALDRAASAKLAVCISVTDQPLNFLDEALRSATMQTYANVQLLVVDCGISDPSVRQWFETLESGEIATASIKNSSSIGILSATLRKQIDGDFVVFLQAADFIIVDAQQFLAANIADSPSSRVFYTDHYEADAHSNRLHPFFKPDFDPILLSNLWYSGFLLATKSELLWKACEAEPEGDAKFAAVLFDNVGELTRLERYERRALSRRNSAIRNIDAHREFRRSA
jgi:glycosyltransferase involved in cell wall biosynthesis